MTVKGRVRAIKLMEKSRERPEYCSEIGLKVVMNQQDSKKNKREIIDVIGEKKYG